MTLDYVDEELLAETAHLTQPGNELLLDLFADTAVIKRVLHSEDWQRLYDFTIHVHVRHLPISSWNVVTYLVALTSPTKRPAESAQNSNDSSSYSLGTMRKRPGP